MYIATGQQNTQTRNDMVEKCINKNHNANNDVSYNHEAKYCHLFDFCKKFHFYIEAKYCHLFDFCKKSFKNSCKNFIITTFQHSKGFWMSKDTHLPVLCGFAGEETGLAVLKRSSGTSDDAPIWSLVVAHRARESSKVSLHKCSIRVD